MHLLENSNLFGAVLAGGKSSRMGTDKALLSVSGKTMLSRTQELLVEVGAKEVLVCRNEPGFVVDELPNSGPIGGIYSALKYILQARHNSDTGNTAKALLVVPVDMPLLDKHCLFELINCREHLPLARQFYNQQFPILLPVSEKVRDCAKAVAVSGNRSITSFLHAIGCKSITTTQNKPFINTNNPAQWQSAIEQMTH